VPPTAPVPELPLVTPAEPALPPGPPVAFPPL